MEVARCRSGDESGPYATLVEISDLSAGSFAFTNEHALVADRRYYRVEGRFQKGTEKVVVEVGRKAAGPFTTLAAFDGNTGSSAHGGGISKIGVNFNEQVYIAVHAVILSSSGRETASPFLWPLTAKGGICYTSFTMLISEHISGGGVQISSLPSVRRADAERVNFSADFHTQVNSRKGLNQ